MPKLNLDYNNIQSEYLVYFPNHILNKFFLELLSFEQCQVSRTILIDISIDSQYADLKLFEALKDNTLEITTGGPVQYLFLSTHSLMVGRAHFSRSPVLPEHDSPIGVVSPTVPLS